MKVSMQTTVLFILTVLAAALSAFVSDFHPGPTAAAAAAMALAVINLVAKSPLLSQQDTVVATVTVASDSPAVHPSEPKVVQPAFGQGPRTGPFFVKDGRHGFSTIGTMIVMTVCAAFACFWMACANPIVKNVENALITLGQYECAQEQVDKLGGAAVAADIQIFCQAATAALPVIQGLIDSATLARLDAGILDSGLVDSSASVKH